MIRIHGRKRDAKRDSRSRGALSYDRGDLETAIAFVHVGERDVGDRVLAQPCEFLRNKLNN